MKSLYIPLFLVLVFTTTYAQNTIESLAMAECRCPKLTLELAQKILKEGKVIDAIPGYIAFAQHIAKSEGVGEIIAIKENTPYLDSDGNCLCTYEAIDKNGKDIYNISLKVNAGINQEASAR
jgi:hypothetical protein